MCFTKWQCASNLVKPDSNLNTRGLHIVASAPFSLLVSLYDRGSLRIDLLCILHVCSTGSIYSMHVVCRFGIALRRQQRVWCGQNTHYVLHVIMPMSDTG